MGTRTEWLDVTRGITTREMYRFITGRSMTPTPKPPKPPKTGPSRYQQKLERRYQLVRAVYRQAGQPGTTQESE